jgi:hypothetical protein
VFAGDTFYLITTNRWSAFPSWLTSGRVRPFYLELILAFPLLKVYSSELKQFSRGSYVTTKE